MTTSSREDFLHFRAPRKDGDHLSIPSSDTLDQQLQRNIAILNQQTLTIAGTNLAALRRETRAQLLNLAGNAALQDCRLFVSGHQPELFHPGVWLKNFALDQLARKYNGIGLNVVIDQDLCRSTSVRSPAWNPSDNLHTSQIPWDSSPSGVAWEIQTIADRKLWDSFPDRVAHTLAPWNIKPLAHQLWQPASQALERGDSVGSALAAARHSIEKAHGLNTIELRSGQLTQTIGFWKLIVHLCTHAERFHAAYENCLADYRHAHRIRSVSHPVPNLQRANTFFELPLWVYSRSHPRRRPIFATVQNNQLEFSDLRQWSHRISLQQSEERWLDELMELQTKQSIYIRPRALLTTMFLRLFVGDWFIHGIGGGKYDQLNDRIITHFFGIEPPKFSVITGTIFLPLTDHYLPINAPRDGGSLFSQQSLDHPRLQNQDNGDALQRWLKAKQLPRHIRFHFTPAASSDSLAWKQAWEEKQTLLANIPPRGSKKQWHQRITEVQRRLERFNQPEIEKWSSQLEAAHRQWMDSKIIQSREYSLALYSEESICKKLRALSQQCVAPKAAT